MSSHDMYSTNLKGPKKIWVINIEKSNCDADDDTDNCSSSEEMNMFYYYSPTREKIHLPNNNKKKSLDL